MENFHDSNENNSIEYPLQTNSTFLLEPTLESELKKLLENKNKSKNMKLDKISFLSKNIQSIGNGIPLIFCNITRLYLSNNNIISLEGIEQFANLTHLSISYNLIEDIYELNHIINPEILLHLNVKGNFFCKNPSFEEVILNLFINLKTLDDLKINNAHKKIIKYGQELSKLIMIFLMDIDEKINKISMLKNVCNLNSEYNMINSSENNLQQFNQDNLDTLIKEFNNIDEISIYKILSLINEKRIINNNSVLPPINDLNNLLLQYLNNTSNNLVTSENDKIKDMYSTLFQNLILNQRRKDYRGFLNYLIMTSEPKLLEFIKSREDNLKYLENDKTSINIICQNFEKILMKYSDYTLENINEIQMMIFYLYFNGNNILSNNEDDIQIIIDQQSAIEKIILNNYEQKVINFREIIPDYFPIFPLDEEFMKNLMNYLKDKVNKYIIFINEIRQIKQNNELKKQQEQNNNNIIIESKEENNIDNNTDEMVNINNINNEYNNNIQNNQIQYSNAQDGYNGNIQEENNIYENNNDNNHEYNLNEPFIYNSQSEFYNKNKINNKTANNFIYTQNKNNFIDRNIENHNEKRNKSEQKSINKNQNKIAIDIKPNQEKIQMKYNIIQLSRILNNIIYNTNIFPKKIEFIHLLRDIQYSSKIIQLYNIIESIWFRNRLRKSLQIIKKNKKTKKNKSRSKSKSKSKKKVIKKKEKKENEDEDEDNEMNKNALELYYNTLKKKIFMIFKFNKFCKNEYGNKKNKINLKEKIANKYNEPKDSDIYKFFHGNLENPNKIAESNMNSDNKINIDNHNDSINIKNIIKKSSDNSNEGIIKTDYEKDKNYNDALKLRNIIDNEKNKIEEENEEENKDDQKLYNTQQSTNEVDKLLNSLKTLYKEIDDKTIKSNKSNKNNEYDRKNKEYINKLREIREKEKEKARKRCGRLKGDENKLLGCPNFIKNTYSSVLKNIY